MSQQHEKPGVSVPDLLHKMKLAANTEVLVSGGQFVNFRRGWAHQVMSSSKVAHWFVRDGFDQTESLCGQQANVRWMYGPGNYPRCQHCIRVMSRRRKSGVPV